MFAGSEATFHKVFEEAHRTTATSFRKNETPNMVSLCKMLATGEVPVGDFAKSLGCTGFGFFKRVIRGAYANIKDSLADPPRLARMNLGIAANEFVKKLRKHFNCPLPSSASSDNSRLKRPCEENLDMKRHLKLLELQRMQRWVFQQGSVQPNFEHNSGGSSSSSSSSLNQGGLDEATFYNNNDMDEDRVFDNDNFSHNEDSGNVSSSNGNNNFYCVDASNFAAQIGRYHLAAVFPGAARACLGQCNHIAQTVKQPAITSSALISSFTNYYSGVSCQGFEVLCGKRKLDKFGSLQRTFVLPMYDPATGAITNKEPVIVHEYRGTAKCYCSINNGFASRTYSGKQTNFCHHVEYCKQVPIDRVIPLDQDSNGSYFVQLKKTTEAVNLMRFFVYVKTSVNPESIVRVRGGEIRCSNCHAIVKDAEGRQAICPHIEVIMKLTKSESAVAKLFKAVFAYETPISDDLKYDSTKMRWVGNSLSEINEALIFANFNVLPKAVPNTLEEAIENRVTTFDGDSSQTADELVPPMPSVTSCNCGAVYCSEQAFLFSFCLN